MSKEDFYIKLKNIFTKFKCKNLPFILDIVKINYNKLSLLAQNNKELIIKTSVPILIIALGIYACGSGKRTAEKTVSELFLISDEIRLKYSDKPDYWRLSTDYAIKEELISSSYIKNGKIILHNDKELFVGYGKDASIVLPRSLSFDLIIKNLNKTECILFLESKIDENNLVKLENITLSNSNNDYVFSWGDKEYPLPITSYIGKKICNNENNTIFWTVK